MFCFRSRRVTQSLPGSWRDGETTMNSEAHADRLAAIASALARGGPEALLGVRSLLRECEDRYPGCIEQMAAGLQLDRVLSRKYPSRA